MNANTIRRIHRIACLSILVALVVWAQGNSAVKIQSIACPSAVSVGVPAVICTVTLTKAAPKGGLLVVPSSAPATLILTYPVTATMKTYPSKTATATTSTITKSVTITTSGPVTVPQGQASTSFQVRAQ